MDAIKGFIEWIGDLLSNLVEAVVNIVDWLLGTVEIIKTVLEIPNAALDIINKLVDYFPTYLWAPVFALITLVLVFRVLKITLSGG